MRGYIGAAAKMDGPRPANTFIASNKYAGDGDPGNASAAIC